MPDSSRRIHFAARALVGFTFFLVILGGLVTSRDAGLAVPDWPLSFGTVNPPRWYAIENVRTEHGHRLVAGAVALCTLVLAGLVHRFEPRRRVRNLSKFAAGLVLFQAALGGLRVLQLSVDLAMVHAFSGQIFFATVVSLAVLTSPHWKDDGVQPPTSSLASVWAVIGLVLTQLVVGVIIRHQGEAARPLVSNTLFYVHVLGAIAVFGFAAKLKSELAELGNHYLSARSATLLALVTFQILLGLASFAATETMVSDRQATFIESWVPTLHVATGAATLALTLTCLLHIVHRRTGAVAPAVASGLTPAVNSTT